MIKVAILGTGVCANHFLKGVQDIRYPPGVLVQIDNQYILLDCSEAIRFRIEQVGVDYSKIKHIAVSHSHPDHFALMHFLQSQYCKGLWGGENFKNDNISIYCPKQITNEFDLIWDFHFPEKRRQRYPYPLINLISMSSDVLVTHDLGFAKISSANVFHGYGKIDALAFRIEAADRIISYSGDSGECAGLRLVARNADLFICECSASIGQEASALEYGHLTPYQVGILCKEMNVKKVILVHYTGLNSKIEMINNCLSSGYTGEVSVGEDFEQTTL